MRSFNSREEKRTILMSKQGFPLNRDYVVLMTFTLIWNVNYPGCLNKRKLSIDEFIEERRAIGDKCNPDSDVIKTQNNN